MGRQGDAFTSLSEENQVYYANVFWEPEEITPEESAGDDAMRRDFFLNERMEGIFMKAVNRYDMKQENWRR